MAQKTHMVKAGPHPRPHVSPSPLLQRQPPVTSFLCYLLALFQIHREHVYTQNALSMNTSLHWSYCSPYFPPKRAPASGRTILSLRPLTSRLPCWALYTTWGFSCRMLPYSSRKWAMLGFTIFNTFALSSPTTIRKSPG